jgi:magnesium-transporting ATPase (P-type)
VAVVYLFSCRSLHRPLWALPAFSNRWVWAGAAAMLLAQLAFTYLPTLNALFQTAPIGGLAWLWIAAVAGAAGVVVEAAKWLRLRLLS